ncbi:MAG: hypothetical protein JRE71_19320 [Deltaproteobacteria bacterium]|nr:hypothetical protein [Deltaproteobacteria bacterium]
MRFWVGAVLLFGLLFGLGSPVRALVIDDFSVGVFNLQGGSGGITGTQVCGSFCLGGSREVFIQSGNAILDATVQLFPGDAVNAMPDGGGTLSFSYAPLGGNVLDLTVGGTATQSEVWFTAFDSPANVSVTVEDDLAVSETVVLTSVVFSPVATPSAPGIAVIPHSSFVSGVDLENLVAYTVTIDATAAGDYHTSLIQIPVPAPSKTNVLSLPGNTVTSGAVGAYPSTPPLDILVSVPPQPIVPPDPVTPEYEIELTLVDVTNGGGQIPASVAGMTSPDDDHVVFLATTLPSAPTSATLQYRLVYQPPTPVQPPEPVVPDDSIPVLSWNLGDNHFEVMVDVMTGRGVQTLTLSGEAGLSPPVNITSVSVAKGASTLITVGVTGAGASSPSLQLACNGGKHLSSVALPVFTPRPFALLLLAVGIAGVVSIGRARRRVPV